MSNLSKDIYILGGPNGAGKTTAAKVLLPQKLPVEFFVNADEIARRIAPGNPDTAAFEAGRRMIGRIRELIRAEESFAFETTCAAKTYIKLLHDCRVAGWRVSLLYLWLPSPEYSIARVERRVKEGGHFIPGEVVRRRYHSGLRNMYRLYLPLADDVTIYDNRDDAMHLIARRAPDSPLVILDEELWTRIRRRPGEGFNRSGNLRCDRQRDG